METYTETILRYRIMRHDDLPESHKEAYRERGINPDEIWNLVWSMETMEAAEECLAEENANKADWQTFKIVDAGETTQVEREIW